MPDETPEATPELEPPLASGEKPHLAIRVMMMPRDTNALGTIFGGIILSYIDQAGAVEAHRRIRGRLVTVAIREVDFLDPVFVGDLVSFYTRILRQGRTSVTVGVSVEAERRTRGGGTVKVTEAELVFVRVDERNRPIPIERFDQP